MINTKLIIVDGMPGSGKSTTARIISEKLNGSNHANVLLLETSNSNPLFMNTPALASLKSEDESRLFVQKVKEMYAKFVEERADTDEVVIIESVIFQGIVSVTSFKGLDEGKLRELLRYIQQVLSTLNPVLVYYYQVDVERNWRWICELRGPEFAKACGLNTDKDFQRASNGWSKAQDLCCSIINEWDIPKLIIRNQDYKWEEYMKQIMKFLQLEDRSI